MNLDVLVKGDDAAAQALRSLADRSEETPELFRKIADVLMRGERERWNGAARWDPLDPDTIRRKARSGGRTAANAARPLRATGVLERALTVWRAPGQKFTVTGEELRFGIVGNGVAYYGKFHQDGKGVPKRIILATSAKTRVRVRETLLDHLFGR